MNDRLDSIVLFQPARPSPTKDAKGLGERNTGLKLNPSQMPFRQFARVTLRYGHGVDYRGWSLELHGSVRSTGTLVGSAEPTGTSTSRRPLRSKGPSFTGRTRMWSTREWIPLRSRSRSSPICCQACGLARSCWVAEGGRAIRMALTDAALGRKLRESVKT